MTMRWGRNLLLWTLTTAIRASPRRLVALIACTVIQVGLTPLELHGLRYLVDIVTQWESPTQYSAIAIAMLAQAAPAVLVLATAALLRYAVGAASTYLNTAARAEVGGHLYERIARKCVAIPLVDLENPEFHNRLQRAREAAASRVADAVEQTLTASLHIATAFTLVGIVVLAHPAVAAIMVLTLPVMYWAYSTGTQNVWQVYRGQSPEVRRANYLSDLMVDHKAGHEIRLYDLAAYLRQRWHDLMAGVHRQTLAALRRNEFRRVLASLLPAGISLAGALLLLEKVSDGALTIGEYVVLVTALLRFGQELDNGVFTASRLRETLLFCSDFREFLGLPEEVPDRGAVNPFILTWEIVFQNVHFSYPGSDVPVLKGINLHIRAGEHLALVGENGAGKTTLVKLLLGLYKPTAGRILIDGVDLQHISQSARNQAMTAVFQDFTQYHLTLRENVGFGSLAQMQDDLALRRALSASGAESLVDRLPNGMDTVLGKEMGEADLSGGEWQRIAIARAFLRDASVVVLDEPTAALDPLAEAELYARFAELAAGRTVLMVTHRLGSARLASRIAVLKEGQIVEEGTHDELVRLGGEYARMFRAQAHWYADREDVGA